ncbi:glutamate--cysteine ligase [Soehngenia saccharolytica]|nr:glutamate--cysteine ligase [Soehngenia saccharolytica]
MILTETNLVKRFAEYIRSGEKEENDLKLGLEIEHFVVYKDDLRTVSYYGEDGVESSLEEFSKNAKNIVKENGHIIEVDKDDYYITLEPGSQLEISIEKNNSIMRIEQIYKDFVNEFLPILTEKNQTLINLGYHPVTRIDEIKLIPKERYNIMYDYFNSKGKYAHNMMKGTAATQVSIDYTDEADYAKKMRVSNALSPILFAIFENAFIFEGKPTENHCTRALIWENCDDDRTGIVVGSLDDDFKYQDYANYILNRPPIFTVRNGEIIKTLDKKTLEIIDEDNLTYDEIKHIFSMFFPDVRTKTYIEIRMMDSVPFELALSTLALIEGLFYNQRNLDYLYEKLKKISLKEVEKAKEEIIKNGLFSTYGEYKIIDIAKGLLKLAYDGLDESERIYLEPLNNLCYNELNPYEKTKRLYENSNKLDALRWAIVKGDAV